jgi:hypothetical protein
VENELRKGREEGIRRREKGREGMEGEEDGICNPSTFQTMHAILRP